MSFGFSPSDIITVINLTTKAYKGWRDACGDYADLTGSLDALCIVLRRVKVEAEKQHSILVRNTRDQRDLQDVLHDCRRTVREIDGVIAKYSSLGLGKSREKNWDKIRFGNKNIEALHAKLDHNRSALTSYLDVVGLGSLARIEQSLSTIPEQMQQIVDSLAEDIRAGRREGSILSTYEDDEKEVWKQFRRELIGDGFRSSDLHRHKPRIRQYLRRLADQGLLVELEVEETPTPRTATTGSGDDDKDEQVQGGGKTTRENLAPGAVSDSNIPAIDGAHSGLDSAASGSDNARTDFSVSPRSVSDKGDENHDVISAKTKQESVDEVDEDDELDKASDGITDDLNKGRVGKINDEVNDDIELNDDSNVGTIDGTDGSNVRSRASKAALYDTKRTISEIFVEDMRARIDGRTDEQNYGQSKPILASAIFEHRVSSQESNPAKFQASVESADEHENDDDATKDASTRLSELVPTCRPAFTGYSSETDVSVKGAGRPHSKREEDAESNTKSSLGIRPQSPEMPNGHSTGNLSHLTDLPAGISNRHEEDIRQQGFVHEYIKTAMSGDYREADFEGSELLTKGLPFRNLWQPDNGVPTLSTKHRSNPRNVRSDRPLYEHLESPGPYTDGPIPRLIPLDKLEDVVLRRSAVSTPLDALKSLFGALIDHAMYSPALAPTARLTDRGPASCSYEFFVRDLDSIEIEYGSAKERFSIADLELIRNACNVLLDATHCQRPVKLLSQITDRDASETTVRQGEKQGQIKHIPTYDESIMASRSSLAKWTHHTIVDHTDGSRAAKIIHRVFMAVSAVDYGCSSALVDGHESQHPCIMDEMLHPEARPNIEDDLAMTRWRTWFPRIPLLLTNGQWLHRKSKLHLWIRNFILSGYTAE